MNAQNATITISTNINRHKISPYIYGVNGNYADSAVKSIRQGGNRWTTYNWETGASNSGKDYNNVTDSYLLSGISNDYLSKPGCVATYNHSLAKNLNQFFLTTVQSQGYVAGLGGSVTKAPSKYWYKVIPKKNGSLSLTPNLTDSTVYIDEYINFLKTDQGYANKGGINAYSIDNEPELWFETHPMVQANPLSIASLIDKTVSTAFAIKSVDSTALVFGPALANWYGCKNFGGNDNLWNTVYLSKYKWEWFVSMYLDTMKVLSNQKGKRLLDVIDIHWYPEASGTDGIGIVNTSGGSEPISQAAIKARIQNPRSLWDPTYIEKSNVANGSAIQLIPRLKTSINKHYPNTKISISEYRFGSEDHFSGGLAFADVLGVFGREDVFFATKWYATGSTAFQRYSKVAFDLFTNYNGKYSSFGDISVQSLSSSNDTLSSFASIDKQKKLHIVVINKMATPTKTDFIFTDSYYKNAEVFGFDSTSAINTKRDSIKTITGYNKCNYILPAYSALHFIFEPLVVPQITSITTDTLNNKIVYVHFNSAIKNEVLPIDSFIIKEAVDTLKISAIVIKGDTLIINLIDTIGIHYSDLILSYANFTIHDTNNVALFGNKNIPILNNLKGSTPVLLESTLLSDGKTISYKFSKSIVSINKTGFSVKANGTNQIIDSIAVTNDVLTILLHKRESNTDSLIGSILNSNMQFDDGSSIQTLSAFKITNNGPNYPLTMNNAEIINAGFIVKLQLNKPIAQTTDLSKIKVLINDTIITFTKSISSFEANLNLTRKIEYGDVVKIMYVDSGYIQSIDGAYLGSLFVTLLNPLKMSSPRVVIPGRIENENLYYNIGTLSSRTDTNASNGRYIQINTNDRVAYKFYSPKDTLYSINLKVGSGNTSLIYTIDNVDIDTIGIPDEGAITNLLEYGILKKIGIGNHTIEVTDLANLINLDYIDFKYGNHIPKALIIYTSVASNGLTFNIDFNGFVKNTPDPSLFTLTVDGQSKPIKSIAINKTSLIFSVLDTIYKKQSVQLSLLDSTIETTNGGYLALFNRSIVNYSKVIKTGISSYNNSFFISLKHTQLSHNLPSNATISIFNILGVKVMTISAVNQVISLDQLSSGCYFVVATLNAEIIHQDKIILSK